MHITNIKKTKSKKTLLAILLLINFTFLGYLSIVNADSNTPNTSPTILKAREYAAVSYNFDKDDNISWSFLTNPPQYIDVYVMDAANYTIFLGDENDHPGRINGNYFSPTTGDVGIYQIPYSATWYFVFKNVAWWSETTITFNVSLIEDGTKCYDVGSKKTLDVDADDWGYVATIATSVEQHWGFSSTVTKISVLAMNVGNFSRFISGNPYTAVNLSLGKTVDDGIIQLNETGWWYIVFLNDDPVHKSTVLTTSFTIPVFAPESSELIWIILIFLIPSVLFMIGMFLKFSRQGKRILARRRNRKTQIQDK